MTKTAVFVEGQTELILLREYLLRKFNWTVDIECRRLHKEQFQAAEYSNSFEGAEHHFLLANIGNDQKVLSVLLAREKGLLANGYTKIIGLRDMYSREYREFSKVIDNDLNNEFITNQAETLQNRESTAKLFFAIMEIEAWLLGMPDIIVRVDSRLTVDFIDGSLGFGLGNIDPERTFFHPAKIMNDIFELAGQSYDKAKGNIEALANVITCEDYDELYRSGKCDAFKPFYDELLQ